MYMIFEEMFQTKMVTTLKQVLRCLVLKLLLVLCYSGKFATLKIIQRGVLKNHRPSSVCRDAIYQDRL